MNKILPKLILWTLIFLAGLLVGKCSNRPDYPPSEQQQTVVFNTESSEAAFSTQVRANLRGDFILAGKRVIPIAHLTIMNGDVYEGPLVRQDGITLSFVPLTSERFVRYYDPEENRASFAGSLPMSEFIGGAELPQQAK